MKIFAIINNYGRDCGETPFGGAALGWYQMSDSSVLRSGNPFFVPDFDNEFMAFPSVVYRIGRLGKSIAPRFADRYIEAWGMAAAVVAPGLLRRLRETGMPWSEAVSFDRSCLLGNLQPINTLNNNSVVIKVCCGEYEMSYRHDSLRHRMPEIIELLSRNNTLKNGDLILAGLMPQGIILTPGTHLSAYCETKTILIDINIR